MPSGKKHEQINVAAIIVIIILFYAFISGNAYFVLFLLGYLFGTYWMGPDLDIKSRPYNRWSIFKFIWIPYQKLGHRSVYTHSILISDILRYIYLIIILLPVWVLIALGIGVDPGDIWGSIQSFITNNGLNIVAFFAGNVLASTLHILSDKLNTRLKKRQKSNR